ncbi:MAG: DUF2357 domain-containing protein [Myxococcales bacterium]|nr:DUF2357 domain-containing protein [Myxococcales bacterium]
MLVRTRPDEPLRELGLGELASGFGENLDGEFTIEGEHWELEVDDEPIAAERRGGRCHWRWTPGFYAGEVRARLIDRSSGSEHELRLDVSPSAAKLGRERFAELIAELRREQPEFVLGCEPAMDRMGSLGRLDDPLLAYGKLRLYAADFVRSLARVLDAPVRRLRQERRLLTPGQVRRVDRQTVLQALREPQLAARLTGRESPQSASAAVRFDAPVVSLHLDEPANRCIKAITQAVLRRVIDCRQRLASKIAKQRESSTRTTLTSRWPVRERFLLGLEYQLERALRGPVLSAVTRPEISAAGLNTISAQPIYARTHRLGWRALGLGLVEGGPEEELWLPPTWELYERWCFVAMRRVLRDRFGFESLPTTGAPRSDLGWLASDHHGRRAWLGFQVVFPTWSAKPGISLVGGHPLSRPDSDPGAWREPTMVGVRREVSCVAGSGRRFHDQRAPLS